MRKSSSERYYQRLQVEKNREILLLKKELGKWKKRATLDSMTGLINKKQGIRILDDEIRKIEFNKKPLSIAFIDIDGLKKINDHYGHCEGDRLLTNVSRLIKHNIRYHDEIFRFGGDEFVVIFPNTTERSARLIWKRITEKIENFNKQMKKKYSIKLSIGFIEYKENRDSSANDLLNLADWKMYGEKERKREEY